MGWILVIRNPEIRVRMAAENAAAKHTAENLNFAVSLYFTEFREFPGNHSDNADFDSETDAEFFRHLSWDPAPANENYSPRNIVFFTDRTARRNPDGSYRRGLSRDDLGRYEL